VQSDGLFFTDVTQTRLYTGEYREYFDDGSLKVEMNIKDGKPEGAYIVYFSNGKPNEVRAYRNGEFHGTWRTYNEAGLLIADNGKKSGTWYMWDEKGKLISEKKY
ncbi:MAG: toxin-antitoxin system YwqK family antitoxin, partial [Bacteroidales bacterium]|nr:toxin-antitoxin system YwqK family antitoxin [Bacteroidales bacterium]